MQHLIVDMFTSVLPQEHRSSGTVEQFRWHGPGEEMADPWKPPRRISRILDRLLCRSSQCYCRSPPE